METFSALLAICAGNSPVPGEFLAQRPVTRSFDVFFDLRLNKRLSKQSWGWWFETPSRPLWRHCNDRHNLPVFFHTWHKYICVIVPILRSPSESIDYDISTTWKFNVPWTTISEITTSYLKLKTHWKLVHKQLIPKIQPWNAIRKSTK